MFEGFFTSPGAFVGGFSTSRRLGTHLKLGPFSQAPAARVSRCRAGAPADLDEVLSLPPSFWDDAAHLEWCAVYINLARRADRKDGDSREGKVK